MEASRGDARGQMLMARICIISSGCLCHGPRVVKEADALAAAGHEVVVVGCPGSERELRWDEKLAVGRAWRYRCVRWDRRARRGTALGLLGKVAQIGARNAARVVGPRPGLAELAHTDRFAALLHRSRDLQPDLFIAHNLAALPAAWLLANRSGARLGFDLEDDHLGELPDDQWQSPLGRRTDALMRRYLPHCDHLTAASEEMADAIANRYGVVRPTAVHNVFPWSERASIDGARRERGRAPLSIYWYSQTMGTDRGLQDVVRACARLRGDFELHLRGDPYLEADQVLLDMARELRIANRLRLYRQVEPTELLSRTAEHDVGLALEPPVARNRLYTVANKLFFYLVAGLAVAATDTPGQRRVMETIPGVGLMYRSGDDAALAAGLQRYLDQPEALAAAREASLRAAEDRWNWEREQGVLVDAVRRVLDSPHRS